MVVGRNRAKVTPKSHGRDAFPVPLAGAQLPRVHTGQSLSKLRLILKTWIFLYDYLGSSIYRRNIHLLNTKKRSILSGRQP